MKPKKVVITGGPGTGKSSIINELISRGHLCYEEISRQITLEAREQGIEQLFLTEPLLFSEKLLEGRSTQFKNASKETSDVIFLDRGIPDILAYMDYIGDDYPQKFIDASKSSRYDMVFVLAPWETIFTSDDQRYENFEQATIIHEHLLKTYHRFGYNLIDVPFESIKKRTDFVLDALNLQ
ncbi:AAA family ATPase [Winogradskyella ursingii]|uniref:AAA family ATPase n=1 Tax=Winogradskyella ursingii TaxID=2686079 RepID=UPI0015CA934D|nr:ATP-binding protein [Winogradskyella ursingii]